MYFPTNSLLENKKRLVMLTLMLSVIILLNPIQHAEAKDMGVTEDCLLNGGWSATITDSEGNPLPNVKVSTMAKMSSTSFEESFHTDENGHVLIPSESNIGFVKLSKGGYNDIKFVLSCDSDGSTASDSAKFILDDNATIYSKYTDPNFGFTMEYPKNWDLDDEFLVEGGVFYPAIFYDDIDAYFSFFEIRYAAQEIWVPLNSDAEELTELNRLMDLSCSQSSFAFDGFECKKFESNYSRVLDVDGQKYFETQYSWEMTFDDNSTWNNESILRVIPAKNGNWYLYTESDIDSFEDHQDILYHMLDSFSLSSSDILIYDSLSSFYLKEPTLYDNEKYGFSMMMPAGWGKSDQDLDLGGFSATVFFPKDFSGSFSPQILSMAILTESVDLSDISKSKDLQTFSDTLIDRMSEYGEFETTFENLETFDSMIKLTVRADGKTVNPGFASVPLEFELVGWISDSGGFHFLVYMAEKQDFNQLYPDFRVSSNSFEFYPDLSEKSQSSLKPVIPEWVRNNAGWWANDVITESDFVVGIEHLIRMNVIQVEFSSTGEKDNSPIPSWIKNNAGWWSEKQISDDDFLMGIQFLIENGIISVENPNVADLEQDFT